MSAGEVDNDRLPMTSSESTSVQEKTTSGLRDADTTLTKTLSGGAMPISPSIVVVEAPPCLSAPAPPQAPPPAPPPPPLAPPPPPSPGAGHAAGGRSSTRRLQWCKIPAWRVSDSSVWADIRRAVGGASGPGGGASAGPDLARLEQLFAVHDNNMTSLCVQPTTADDHVTSGSALDNGHMTTLSRKMDEVIYLLTAGT